MATRDLGLDVAAAKAPGADAKCMDKHRFAIDPADRHRGFVGPEAHDAGSTGPLSLGQTGPWNTARVRPLHHLNDHHVFAAHASHRTYVRTRTAGVNSGRRPMTRPTH